MKRRLSHPDQFKINSQSPILNGIDYSTTRYKKYLSYIVSQYNSKLVRVYSKIRFNIININILNILSLCLRGKKRILDIGCGFGLFGCYFAGLYPEIYYIGYDLNENRINMANETASRLGLTNVQFNVGDARSINIAENYDAILMIDLLHHIDDQSKLNLIERCTQHLTSDGRLIIKDITTHPFPKLAFTWILDVMMTKGFDMWYWDEKKFYSTLSPYFNRIETYPITDWLPYPHIVYLCENVSI
ncbi:MAG: class I SAM-dependent methyltransferase [Calditrichaeota bacterium]|nr:MAG: class I SAM-dependent methyltransferase [Calditrichota bacterium]